MFGFPHIGVLKLLKGDPTKNRLIPTTDLDRILRASSADERALWILSCETGFRIGDLLTLRQWQAHPERDELRLKEDKTNNVRGVRLTDRAKEALSWALKLCPERHPLKYLFPARLRSGEADRRRERGGKRHLHRSTVHRHFAAAVKRAGLSGKGYTVHSLRKVYAHRRYEETSSLLEVQRDLGHANISTTMLYVTELTL